MGRGGLLFHIVKKKMFFTLFCYTLINQVGYKQFETKKDDLLLIEPGTDNVAYIYSHSTLYQNIDLSTDTDDPLNTDGAAVTQTLKIDYSSVKLTVKTDLILDIWIVPKTICPSSSLYFKAPTNFTYETRIQNQDLKICLFPVNSPNNIEMMVSHSESQNIKSYTPSDGSLFTENEVVSSSSFVPGIFYSINGQGDVKFELSNQGITETGSCLSNTFKTVTTQKTITNDPIVGLTTQIICPDSKDLTGINIETGFPTVVLVLLVILVLFCIASGVSSCVCKKQI